MPVLGPPEGSGCSPGDDGFPSSEACMTSVELLVNPVFSAIWRPVPHHNQSLVPSTRRQFVEHHSGAGGAKTPRGSPGPTHDLSAPSETHPSFSRRKNRIDSRPTDRTPSGPGNLLSEPTDRSPRKRPLSLAAENGQRFF